MSDSVFDALCEQLAVWKGGHPVPQRVPGLSTRFTSLDEALPAGGWPSAITELLTDCTGIGELSLLLPALAEVSRDRGIVLVTPPWQPYAPAWADAGIDLDRLLILLSCAMRDGLACAEMSLRSGACGAVLIWESGLQALPGQTIPNLALRRLQLAADSGNAAALLFRARRQSVQPSPAAVRIQLQRRAAGLEVTLFKRRGRSGTQQVTLDPYPASLQTALSYRPRQPLHRFPWPLQQAIRGTSPSSLSAR
ncbi:MAG: translesion DNA synthesis-associated protein ImuA [Burkholderiaceae bacterium]